MNKYIFVAISFARNTFKCYQCGAERKDGFITNSPFNFEQYTYCKACAQNIVREDPDNWEFSGE